MHTNIVFQISQELKRIFKIVSRFISFTKVYSEIPFSKNSFHTDPSQSISNVNQSIFSNLRSINDSQKIDHINFKQNRASILFSGLGVRLNFFFHKGQVFLYPPKKIEVKRVFFFSIRLDENTPMT